MSAKKHTSLAARLLIGGAALALSSASFGAATITIFNNDGAGEGFNDPTPAAPVGGNTGTTLGAQRLNLFQAAADVWGATITSSVTIIIRANFDPLTCNATSAVLGSAGSLQAFANFPGAIRLNTAYGGALANKLSGTDLSPTVQDIGARFNSNLGQVGCLTGSPFYLGLDNNHGPLIDLYAVLLHEFGHGLGFQTFTSNTTGAQIVAGIPSVWDFNLFDNAQGLTWAAMPTNAQRQTSAITPTNLVWTGASVGANVPFVLSALPQMNVLTPASIAGAYEAGAASFGPPLTTAGFTGEVMPVVDTSPAGNACTPLSALNALAVNGKIALVDRGICGFTIKVKNAQNAGAVGVIVADNVAGPASVGLGGTDPTITIPAIRVTLAGGNTLKEALKTRSRTRSGVFITMGLNPALRAGADTLGRPFLYTPSVVAAGSSVSHYDTSALPNQLMEPFINGDLTHQVAPPADLTYPLLQDIGW